MAENTREYKGENLAEYPSSYVVVDVETTGLSPEVNEIIEIGALKVVDGQVTDKFQSLVTCNGGVPGNIRNLTGITDEMLATDGVDLKEAISSFDTFIGDAILLGHNVNFDINFLYDAYESILNRPLSNNYVDTLKIAKSLVRDTYNHKLSTLARKFEVENPNAHRVLNDCLVTKAVYEHLKYIQDNLLELRMAEIEKTFKEDALFASAKVAVKSKLKYLEEPVIVEVLRRMKSKTYFALYKTCNVLVVNDNAYSKLQEPLDTDDEYLMFFSSWMYTAQERMQNGSLTVVSESDFCTRLGIPMGIDISRERDETSPLFEKVCVFTGTLDRMSRKQAEKIVGDIGGIIGGGVTKKTNYLILGNNDYNAAVKNGKSAKHKKAEELQSQGFDIEIIPEDVFYGMIGEE